MYTKKSSTVDLEKISLNYLIGFFETDGSAQIIFKQDKTMTLGYRLLPTIVFSQHHTQILDRVRTLLMDHQIPTRLEVGKGRASNLRIEGVLSVKKFLNLLETPALANPVPGIRNGRNRGPGFTRVGAAVLASLYSSKWIDLFILRALYSIIEQAPRQ